MADRTSDWSDLSFLFFSLVPPGTLLQALNSFLSLNPDVHMLPFTSLTHLTVLYAVSHSLLNHSVYSCRPIDRLQHGIQCEEESAYAARCI